MKKYAFLSITVLLLLAQSAFAYKADIGPPIAGKKLIVKPKPVLRSRAAVKHIKCPKNQVVRYNKKGHPNCEF